MLRVYQSTHLPLEDIVNAQAITIRNKAYPVHQTVSGPVIYGKFSQRDIKFLKQIYGVRVEEEPPTPRR